MIFLLKKFIQAIALPPFLPLFLILAGLVLIWRKKKHGLVLAFAGLSVSLFFSIPLTVDFMTRRLESIPAVKPHQLGQAKAIVILGGGQRGWAQEYGADMPNGSTLERLSYGATLARRTGLPLLVTGGALSGGPSEAEVMAKTLDDLFAVKATWIEGRSLDTAENALFSAEMLKRSNIGTVILVTHAAHMRRSVNEFRHVGMSVIPAPTAFLSDYPRGNSMLCLVPNSLSTSNGFSVTHEWAGLLAQYIRHNFSRSVPPNISGR